MANYILFWGLKNEKWGFTILAMTEHENHGLTILAKESFSIAVHDLSAESGIPVEDIVNNVLMIGTGVLSNHLKCGAELVVVKFDGDKVSYDSFKLKNHSETNAPPKV